MKLKTEIEFLEDITEDLAMLRTIITDKRILLISNKVTTRLNALVKIESKQGPNISTEQI